jgi:hypothetical protein
LKSSPRPTSVEGVERAQVVREPSKTVRDRLLVAWLSDLEIAPCRRELVERVDTLLKTREGVLFVLVTARTSTPRSYQALEILTQWSSLAGFYLAPDVKAVRRMVRARAAGVEDTLMASALIEDGKLVVWSCEPKRYVVPVAEIPGLAEINPRHLADLKLNESGSRLRWDMADVGLNLDAVRYYTDPRRRRLRITLPETQWI